MGAYHKTPFLDDRSMKFGVGDCHFHVPVQALDRLAVAGIPNDARTEWGKDLHFIHHLSHTGSTLLSRAIGEIEGTLVLREPYLLRWIAKATALSSSKDVSQAYLKFMLPWLTRRYSSEETVVVKASSTAVRWMRPALKQPGARSVFMYSGLRTHLAVCLARPNERFGDYLYEGLEVQSKVFKEFSVNTATYLELTTAQKMTLAWAKRMLFVAALPKEQVLMVRMDEFLEDTAQVLRNIASFFGLSLDTAKANAITASDIFTKYAKEESVPWNASIQATMLKGRAKAFSANITEGMEFMERLLKEHKVLRKHLGSMVDL